MRYDILFCKIYCVLISIMFGLLVPAIGKIESSLQKCSKHGCIVTQSSKTSSQLPVGPTKCEGSYPVV